MFLTLVDYSGVKSQTIVRTLETLGVNGHDPIPVTGLQYPPTSPPEPGGVQFSENVEGIAPAGATKDQTHSRSTADQTHYFSNVLSSSILRSDDMHDQLTRSTRPLPKNGTAFIRRKFHLAV